MGGTGRPPRCRSERPVLPYPIDRRRLLRLCALVGTQHLFVVMRRRSCVVSGVGGAASGGGAGRAGAARAALGLLVSVVGRPVCNPPERGRGVLRAAGLLYII